MKIHTLGTSAGTQPISGYHHTSIAIESGDNLYFFDAGECCAYTAHLNGVDLLKTRAIFISHTHFDHIGGLGNLLWYIRKLTFVRKVSLGKDHVIRIFCPVVQAVRDILSLLSYSEGGFECEYSHRVDRVDEGLVYDDGVIRVTAVHTNHLPAEENGHYLSYGYRIECEGKTVVFSGDMRIEDIPSVLPDRCDVFMPETGHHRAENIIAAVKDSGKSVGRLIFVHNGGYIMRGYDAALADAQAALPGTVIARDGDCYTI